MEGRKMTEIDALGAWTPTAEDEGINEQELWSLDMTLTDYILPRIIAFRRMKRCGYPGYHPERDGYPVEDVKTYNNLTSEEVKAQEAHAAAEWENILFDIEAAFRTLKDTEDNARTRAQHETIKRGLALFAEHYEHLWD